MRYEVRFTAAARRDLLEIYAHIADRSGPLTAYAYIGRIEDYCHGFADSPKRGTRHDDLVRGLRTIGFERRVTIAFHIDGENVVFDRILYGGRDLGALGDES